MMAVQNSTTVAVVRMDENSSKLLDAIFVLLRGFLGGGEIKQYLAIGQLVKRTRHIPSRLKTFRKPTLSAAAVHCVHKSLCACR
jgi:hypothetical protein